MSTNSIIINCVRIKYNDSLLLSERRICSPKKWDFTELSKKVLDIGDTDLKLPNIFQSNSRYMDLSAKDLSIIYFIGFKIVHMILKTAT